MIYNWVDETVVVDVPRPKNKLVAKYNLDPSKFYITYNGNIGLTQNMDMLLEVAIALEANFSLCHLFHNSLLSLCRPVLKNHINSKMPREVLLYQ